MASQLIQHTLGVIEQMGRLSDPAAIVDAASREFSKYGFEALILTRLPRRTQRLEPYILLNGWPTAWADRYVEAGHYENDPLAQHCMSTHEVFTWAEIPAEYLQSERARKVVSEAREFRLTDGICVPMHTSLGVGGLSLAGSKVELPPGFRGMAQLLSFQIGSAIERSLYAKSGGARLSLRERDVLSWIAAGKSCADVAEVLGLSEFTVADHLKAIRKKLHSTNNAHSVVLALQTGQIRL